MKTYYITKGRVRGCCGHKHKSIAAAARCVKSDNSGCKSQGGYSDRTIRAIENGEERLLTPEEHDEWEWATNR